MDRDYLVAVSVCLLFALTQLPIIGSSFLMWDESAYIGMGKHIFSHGNSGLWEPIRPLLFPFFLGFLWKIGASLFTFRIFAVAMAAGVIIATYLLSRRIMSPAFSSAAALMLAFSPIFFSNSSLVLTDVPSAFLALMAAYFFLRDKFTLAGIFASAAFMARFPHFLVLAAMVAVLFMERRHGQIKSLLAPFAIAMAGFLAINTVIYRDILSAVLPFTSAIQHQGNLVYSVTGIEGIFYYLNVTAQNSFLLLFFLPGAFFLFREKRKESLFAIAGLFYLAYFTVIPNKQERFIIAFLPFLCILSAFWMSRSFLFVRKAWVPAKVAFSLSFGFLVVAAAISAAYTDYGHFKWLGTQQNAEVQQLYSSIPNGTILTTDPRIAVYSDSRILTFYDNPDNSQSEYRMLRPQSGYIIYTPDYYPCGKFGKECEGKKLLLQARILSENKLVENRTINHSNYYLLKVT